MIIIKSIIVGIKDYTKDCWHDFWYWFWDALWDWTNKRCVKCYVWDKNEGHYTKEGSVWYYIKQVYVGAKKNVRAGGASKRFKG